MAKVDVIMPQMGESIAEGTLTRWRKAVGDAVERDEDLFEISTDKVDADIPSPAGGVLAEILVEEGQTVEVNTVVARIDTEGEAGAAPEAEEEAPEGAPEAAQPAEPAEAAEEAPEAEKEAPAAEPVEEPPAEKEVAAEAAEPEADGPEQPERAPEREAPEVPTRAAAETGDGAAPATREERLRTRSTPLVRKIAAEHGVDIAEVRGTGIAGRVTRDDIEAFLEAREEAVAEERAAAPAEAAPAEAVPRRPAAAPEARPAAEDVRPAAAAAPAEAAAPGMMRVPIHGAVLDIRIPKVAVRENDRVEEMSRVRLRTMEHMLMSTRISAHVTSVTEIDFERVVRLRKRWKPRFEEQGVKLTYGPFIMKAVVEGLREYPILNSSVDGTRIVYHSDINLGIAVAVNDGRELIVPVLKNADQLSLMGLARGANELAEKARTKSLDFDDIQGGTFTITNVGVFGNLFGTPIINQPQVAILGTGVIEKRPVVLQDDMGNDAIAIRHRAYFGLSYDHRVVDGAMAAFFLNEVQEVLENFPEESV